MALFRRSAKAVPAIDLPTTGHSGDDALLQQIAARSDLSGGRHWVHYLYFPGEADARAAAEVISAAGWDLQRVARGADGGPLWVVIAERHGAVTSPAAVGEARTFFEVVAATHGGGEYDGWEASLQDVPRSKNS